MIKAPDDPQALIDGYLATDAGAAKWAALKQKVAKDTAAMTAEQKLYILNLTFPCPPDEIAALTYLCWAKLRELAGDQLPHIRRVRVRLKPRDSFSVSPDIAVEDDDGLTLKDD